MSVFNYKFKIEDYKVKDSHRFNEKNLSDFLSDKLTEFSSITNGATKEELDPTNTFFLIFRPIKNNMKKGQDCDLAFCLMCDQQGRYLFGETHEMVLHL